VVDSSVVGGGFCERDFRFSVTGLQKGPKYPNAMTSQEMSRSDGHASRPEFREIFRSEFSYVWNTLIRLGVAPGDVEDVTHDVFLHVHRKLTDYDALRPLRPWLFGFAFRLASDYKKLARHRHERVGLDEERVDDAPRADELLLSAEERKLVEAALARVPIERRAILLLHEVDGYSIPEVARALGVPLNTAYSRLRIAREDLARAVEMLRARQERPVRVAGGQHGK